MRTRGGDGVVANAGIVARSMTLAEMGVDRSKRMSDVNALLDVAGGR